MFVMVFYMLLTNLFLGASIYIKQMKVTYVYIISF